MSRTVVIGGGVAGSSAAYHLAQAGTDTLLIDRKDDHTATSAAAGMISPRAANQSVDETWYNIAAHSYEYFRPLIDDLEQARGDDCGYRERDLLAVGIDDDALGWRDERSFAGSTREIEPRDAVEMCPPLETPQRAIHYEEAARMDGARFVSALRQEGRSHGLEVIDGYVEDIILSDGAIDGVVTSDGRTFGCSRVIVANGARSADFSPQLDFDIPISPARGQSVVLDPHDDRVSQWPVITTLENIVFVPWPEDRLAVGGSYTEGVGFSKQVTVDGIGPLLNEIRRVMPTLADAEIKETRVGTRPVTPDSLPLLGSIPTVDGAYIASGHGGTGLMTGAYSGKMVATASRGEEPAISMTPFDPTRFN